MAISAASPIADGVIRAALAYAHKIARADGAGLRQAGDGGAWAGRSLRTRRILRVLRTLRPYRALHRANLAEKPCGKQSCWRAACVGSAISVRLVKWELFCRGDRGRRRQFADVGAW